MLAVLLLIVWQLDIRLIFYLAVIPGLLAFVMVAFVEERPVAVTAKSKIDVNLRQFPTPYWKYLMATALFGIGNSSNVFLILQTKDIGASLTMTILIYAGFNLVAALISYPAGTCAPDARPTGRHTPKDELEHTPRIGHDKFTFQRMPGQLRRPR